MTSDYSYSNRNLLQAHFHGMCRVLRPHTIQVTAAPWQCSLDLTRTWYHERVLSEAITCKGKVKEVKMSSVKFVYFEIAWLR